MLNLICITNLITVFYSEKYVLVYMLLFIYQYYNILKNLRNVDN